ncbi:MAG: FG-GAP-like repeat-containing protein [Roseburia sp.]|nr:FG-GAP-like repeat-containing protein [Roseburia sp.]
MKRFLAALLVLAAVISLPSAPALAAEAAPVIGLRELYTLVGGEQVHGAHSGVEYVEEAYWSAPVVADVDGDGRLETVHAAYTLTVADAATGSVKWQVNSGKDRSTPYLRYTEAGSNAAGQTFCKVLVKDLDGDGKQEIAVGYANGSISVLDGQGYFKPGWPRTTSNNIIWSLAADDLDGDGKQELIAGLGIEGPTSIYVFNADGTLRSGWPQRLRSQGADAVYSDGIYADGITTGDLDGDGLPEILMPTDNWFINAYNGDGTPVMVSSRFQNSDHDTFDYGGDIPWGAVGLWEDYAQELKRDNGGYGTDLQWESLAKKGRAGTYGPGMGFSTAVCTDVDGDGTEEVVVTALMLDRTVAFQNPSNRNTFTNKDTRYMTVYILNRDRTRFNNGTYNWESIPTNLTASTLGGLLNQSAHDLSGVVRPVPAVADINGDGVNEILFNAFDGKVHCFSLASSSKELEGWPYILPGNNGSTLCEFATAPVVEDLDGDGRPEIVFASHTASSTGERAYRDGALYVVGGDGKLITRHSLHSAIYEHAAINYDNGAYAAPTVADVDGDGVKEILVNTRHYGLCAYKVTPGQATQEPQLVQPNTMGIVVNGDQSRAFTLYTYILYDADGGGTNYVSVRDLAWYMANALWDKKGIYDVSWDGAVNLLPGVRYAAYPGHYEAEECQLRFVGPQRYSHDRQFTVKVNGRPVTMDYIVLYDKDGSANTYYKLRDLGTVMDIFDVDWDGPNRTAHIITRK